MIASFNSAVEPLSSSITRGNQSRPTSTETATSLHSPLQPLAPQTSDRAPARSPTDDVRSVPSGSAALPHSYSLSNYSTSQSSIPTAYTTTPGHLLYDGPLLAPLRLSTSPGFTSSMDRTSSGPLARPGQRQGPASSGNLGTTNAPAPHVTGSLPLSYYFTRVERPQSSTADRTRAQISPRPLEEPAHSSSESSAAAPTPSIGPLLPSSSPLDQLRQSVQLARAEVDLLPTGQELARGVVEDITGANPSRRETGPGARADMERVLRGARFALRSAVSFAER